MHVICRLRKDASPGSEGLEDSFCCSRRRGGCVVDASSTAKDPGSNVNDPLPANATTTSSRTTLFSIRLEFSPSRFFLPLPAMIFPFIEAVQKCSTLTSCDTTTEGGGAASCSDTEMGDKPERSADSTTSRTTRPTQFAFPFLYQRILRLVPLLPTPISIPVCWWNFVFVLSSVFLYNEVSVRAQKKCCVHIT